MAVISITRLRVRSWYFMPDFLLHSTRIARRAQAAPGNLGIETMRESGLVFWSKAAWRDEAAMHAFLDAGAREAALPRLNRWCSEVAVVFWEQETPRLPFWEDAGRRMQREGRTVPVKNPSDNQAAGRIPPMKQ